MLSTLAEKKRCILYTSVMGDGLKFLLPLSDEFCDEYALSAQISYRADRIAEDLPLSRADLDACSLLICHDPDTIIVDPDQRRAYERLLDSVPASCRVIRIPHFYFRVFWPFHSSDPRNLAPFPQNHHGHPRFYPFGDAYVLELLDGGMPPEAVIAHYLDLDVAKAVDLDALYARTLADARAADELSDIKLAPHVEETFGLAAPFVAFHLPSNFLLLCYVNEILGLLGLPPLPERLLHRLQPLLKPQVPVHPSIGRHFGLPYIAEDTRYYLDRRIESVNQYQHLMDPRRKLTFAEYIRDYVYFK